MPCEASNRETLSLVSVCNFYFVQGLVITFTVHLSLRKSTRRMFFGFQSIADRDTLRVSIMSNSLVINSTKTTLLAKKDIYEVVIEKLLISFASGVIVQTKGNNRILIVSFYVIKTLIIRWVKPSKSFGGYSNTRHTSEKSTEMNPRPFHANRSWYNHSLFSQKIR